jgi:hypothetical protein
VRPAPWKRSVRHLSLHEREEIFRGVAGGESLRVIAGRLCRAVSTISREVARNDGRDRYRAHRAARAAWQRACRSQVCKLATNSALRAEGGGQAGGSLVALADLGVVTANVPWHRGDSGEL